MINNVQIPVAVNGRNPMASHGVRMSLVCTSLNVNKQMLYVGLETQHDKIVLNGGTMKSFGWRESTLY